jgi:hypothetical protein
MATSTLPPGDLQPGAGTSRSTLWHWAAALSAVAAGGLHVAAAATHLGAHDLVVGFFLLVALGQLGFGAWVAVSALAGIRPDVRLVALGLLGTVALIALHLVAHTTDLLAAFQVHDTAAGHDATGHSTPTSGTVALDPGPTTTREPAGPLGTATVAVELGTVLALTALLPSRWRSRTANVLLCLGGAAWILWLTGVLA